MACSSFRTFLNLHLTTPCTRQRLSLLYTAAPIRPFSSTSRSTQLPPSNPYTKEYKPPPTSSILEDSNEPIDLSEDPLLASGARPGTPPIHARSPPPKATPDEWRAHREALKARFPEGWQPPRKISRDAMAGLRQMHRIDPGMFTTSVLAERFRISPEAVRRILKSRWEPSEERREKLVRREGAMRKAAGEARRERGMRVAEEMFGDDQGESVVPRVVFRERPQKSSENRRPSQERRPRSSERRPRESAYENKEDEDGRSRRPWGRDRLTMNSRS